MSLISITKVETLKVAMNNLVYTKAMMIMFISATRMDNNCKNSDVKM